MQFRVGSRFRSLLHHKHTAAVRKGSPAFDHFVDQRRKETEFVSRHVGKWDSVGKTAGKPNIE